MVDDDVKLDKIENKSDLDKKKGGFAKRNEMGVGSDGKAEQLQDYDHKAPKVEKPKPTPAVDPDADLPDDPLATRAAKAKRRKAKIVGQTASLLK